MSEESVLRMRAERSRSFPCRVVHLIPQEGVGGVELAARSMAAREDIPFSFTLTLVAGGSSLVDKRHVHESTFRSTNNPIAHLAVLIRLLNSPPDILVCSLWRTVPIGLLMKLLRPQTKTIVFLHSCGAAHVVDHLLSRLMVRASDVVWADSVATSLARVRDGEKPTRIVSLVTEHFQPTRPQRAVPAPRFVCWTRLLHAKGIDRALRLVREVASLRPDTRFEVWGPDNGALSTLQRLARELDLQGVVSFMGTAERRQMPDIARSHSFYLQLSRREGSAVSVVEAMQLGLVPVVTAVGEMKRYCQHLETGVICDPEDLPATARTVIALLDKQSDYARIRDNARRYWKSVALYSDDFCEAVRTQYLVDNA